MFTLITGGSRSGKSTFAEQKAEEKGKDVIYIATAGVKDEEMRERVKMHLQRRPEQWLTIEEELELEKTLQEIGNKGDAVVLIDCLTLWLANMMSEYWACIEREGFTAFLSTMDNKMRSLVRKIKELPHDVILVSNEVGWGIVPESKSGRFFQDLSGKMSQIAAREADRVYLMVAGLPLKVK